MTKILPPLTKTIFALAVAGPVLLSLEGVTALEAATAYQLAGFVFKALGAGVLAALGILSLRNQQTP